MFFFAGQDETAQDPTTTEATTGTDEALDTESINADVQGVLDQVSEADSYVDKFNVLWSEQNLEIATALGLRVIGVLLFLFFAWIMAGWAKRLCFKALQKARIDLTLTRFISNSIKWVVILLAALACLPVFGIESTSFAAVLAAVGFAIGFALQGTLSNLAAGMMLLIFRPFKIDDLVKIDGELGTVFEIELFSTTMDTLDNRRLIIPNGNIFGSTIENLTFHPKRRIDVAVGTDYPADLDAVRSILENAAHSLPGILKDPEPAVVLLELGGSSINWSVRVWANTTDYWPIRQALTRAVKIALDEANVGIPYPQLDVHLQNNNPPQ